jgi:uncharacterized protein
VTILLDANVLVALSSPDHVHHDAGSRWFDRLEAQFATCTVTELALVRVLIAVGAPTAVATRALDAVIRHHRHVFWTDEAPSDPASLGGVIGHRQVTDAYLVDLARRHGGLVATFDAGLHAAHPASTELVPA